MTITKNVRLLKELMKRYELTRPKVAEILGMSLSSVDAWLADITSTRYRKMPSRMLELLKFKLGEM
jgi:transcriptional regulator with XRE-family HTH domain